MKLSAFFAWYDLWIGAYWSAESRTLYLCPLPMLCVAVTFRPTRGGLATAKLYKAELHPASWWHCPACGRSHFARNIRPELSDEEAEEILREKGLSRDEVEGEFLMMPETVDCPACRLTFKTTPDDLRDSEVEPLQ